jgi:hypothetical protein
MYLFSSIKLVIKELKDYKLICFPLFWEPEERTDTKAGVE